MKPYSNDLRLRIIEAIQDNELSQAEIARQFSVGKSFVEKLWQRFRTTGTYQAITVYRRGPERKLKSEESILRDLVKAKPDATLAELCEEISNASGKPWVSAATMCVELQRLKLPLKKSRSTPRKEILSEFKRGGRNIAPGLSGRFCQD